MAFDEALALSLCCGLGSVKEGIGYVRDDDCLGRLHQTCLLQICHVRLRSFLAGSMVQTELWVFYHILELLLWSLREEIMNAWCGRVPEGFAKVPEA